ncbi:MAG: response regulator [Magnetococcales bacterium]|nr:response regulator [Magnetococcales bacterium]MBF0154885.1 response regulator [Magnetococcales bacterium]
MCKQNNPQRILIVDDVPANVKLLAGFLHGSYSLFLATDGASALEIAGMEHPDLILLDIMMPGMDGYKVCQALKSHGNTKDIPVIFTSAMNDEEDISRGLALGAADYIVKPIRKNILLECVRKHLDG